MVGRVLMRFALPGVFFLLLSTLRFPAFAQTGLQFSGQYSWLVRHPWNVPSRQPASANLNMLYLSFRYALSAPPAVSKIGATNHVVQT
jgi:hypothetical protein